MPVAKFRKLLARKEKKPASLPEGLRVYAVGDIHGRSDLLARLAEQIREDLKSARGEAVTIFLGDYVDRGPDSRGVLERLACGDFPTPYVVLRGNHEEMLLNFFEDESVLEGWRQFGGLEMLHSYGVDISQAKSGVGFLRTQKELAERMPPSHRELLEQTVLTAAYGDYFFCHAGARPHIPLEFQSAADLLWIREEFLDFTGSWEKIIVHGHTPVSEPSLLPNRINVDTGAFITSVLTAVVLEGAERRLLSTGPRPSFRG